MSGGRAASPPPNSGVLCREHGQGGVLQQSRLLGKMVLGAGGRRPVVWFQSVTDPVRVCVLPSAEGIGFGGGGEEGAHAERMQAIAYIHHGRFRSRHTTTQQPYGLEPINLGY